MDPHSWPLKFCPKAGDDLFSVKFLYETSQEMTPSAPAYKKKNINDQHVALSHPSEVIIYATAKSMGIQVTGTFKLCKDCTTRTTKNGGVCNKAVASLKILGENLFFDISFPSTPTFGGKKHWLLVIEDSTGYKWSFFKKGKYTCDVTMQVRMLLPKRPANRKKCGWNWSSLPLVLLNRMAMFNGSLQPPLTRYAQCSMVGNSLLF